MTNYADAYDFMMCEPPDNSEAEAQDQARRDMAFDDYLDDGWLPGDNDTSHVDEAMLELHPTALDELITAKSDEELVAIAKRLRDARIEIIETIIADNLIA